MIMSNLSAWHSTWWKRNGEGVVGMITNHGYLDNPTFRGMRWHLMNSFDAIYVLDLHGNSRKKEVKPNGDPDKNVFNITTGVSIIIAWKTKREKGTDKPLAQVFRGDLWGEREEKFKALEAGSLDSGLFQHLDTRAPRYYFKPIDYDLFEEYKEGFKITKFMPENSTGIKTHRDKFVFDIDEENLANRIKDFYDRTQNEEEIKDKLNLKDNRDWSVQEAREKGNFDGNYIKDCAYRPFDTRSLYYDPDLIDFDRHQIMRYFQNRG